MAGDFSLSGRRRPMAGAGKQPSGRSRGTAPLRLPQVEPCDTDCHVGRHGRSAAVNPNRIFFMRLSEQRPSTGRPWRASEVRPLMELAPEIWAPARMRATFPFFERPAISDPAWAAGKRALTPWTGRITCLPPDLAARAKVPVDTHVETLDDGAALVTLRNRSTRRTEKAWNACALSKPRRVQSRVERRRRERRSRDQSASC